MNTVVVNAEDVHSDHQRQRKHLEKSVDSLNTKLKKDLLVHKKDHQRIMQENIALIREINQLRREIATMRSNQKAKADAGGALGGSSGGGAGGGGRIHPKIRSRGLLDDGMTLGHGSGTARSVLAGGSPLASGKRTGLASKASPSVAKPAVPAGGSMKRALGKSLDNGGGVSADAKRDEMNQKKKVRSVLCVGPTYRYWV